MVIRRWVELPRTTSPKVSRLKSRETSRAMHAADTVNSGMTAFAYSMMICANSRGHVHRTITHLAYSVYYLSLGYLDHGVCVNQAKDVSNR